MYINNSSVKIKTFLLKKTLIKFPTTICSDTFLFYASLHYIMCFVVLKMWQIVFKIINFRCFELKVFFNTGKKSIITEHYHHHRLIKPKRKKKKIIPRHLQEGKKSNERGNDFTQIKQMILKWGERVEGERKNKPSVQATR